MVKKEKNVNILFILARYVGLIILLLLLPLVYKIVTPLTVYAVGFLLKLIYPVSINNTILVINFKSTIQIISSCVAGSAYLLLVILNLITPMKIKQRVYSLIFSLIVLYLINVLRIFFLTILYVNNFTYFDLTHKLFWYILSTLFVVLIWFASVKLFKIRDTPFYSDAKRIYRMRKK